MRVVFNRSVNGDDAKTSRRTSRGPFVSSLEVMRVQDINTGTEMITPSLSVSQYIESLKLLGSATH